jgi:hypothetical protein
MASLKRAVLEAVPSDAYPLSKQELLSILEGGEVDADMVSMVSLMDDHRFVSEDELAHRLDEAVGVPDVVIETSALDTGWATDE